MKKKMLVVLSMVILLVVLITVPEKVEGETYEYDDLNRVIKVTYDDGSYITYEYDKNGNITSVKVHEAVTSKKEEETTKKPQETTSKQEQATTKKPQETTKKPQETTKKTGETTKKPQETTKKPQETTKKPQEATKKPQEQETTKKPQETTKKVQPPLRGEEETTGGQNVFSPSGIGNGIGTDGTVNPPVINYLPGSQAFDAIKTILESYTGVSGSAGQKTGIQQNGSSQSVNGNQGGSSVQGGGNGQIQNQREQAKEYINKKFPDITKFTLKFVIGIMRTYMSLGQ